MSQYSEMTAPDPLDTAFSAAWLTAQHFPAVDYVLPGIIPEGLTVLTAAPKIGKSWFVLGLAVAAATGGYALGSIPVLRRPVLYLALEDGQRRLQSRLRTIGVDRGPANLTFMTTVPNGVATTIGAFLDRQGDRNPLIVLDTLGKVRPVHGGNDQYQRDYQQMSMLKELVDACPGSSLIIVHHTRKAETTDFLDSVSGTQGLAGAADSILVLRRSRHETDATLSVTSRDAAEGEYALRFDAVTGTWSLDGANVDDAARAAESRRGTDGVGDDMAQIVQAVNRHPEGIKPSDVAILTNMDADKAGRYLRRAADSGRVERRGRGVYGPVRSVRTVRNPDEVLLETDISDTPDTPLDISKLWHTTPGDENPPFPTCRHGLHDALCIRCEVEGQDAP